MIYPCNSIIFITLPNTIVSEDNISVIRSKRNDTYTWNGMHKRLKFRRTQSHRNKINKKWKKEIVTPMSTLNTCTLHTASHQHRKTDINVHTESKHDTFFVGLICHKTIEPNGGHRGRKGTKREREREQKYLKSTSSSHSRHIFMCTWTYDTNVLPMYYVYFVCVLFIFFLLSHISIIRLGLYTIICRCSCVYGIRCRL